MTELIEKYQESRHSMLSLFYQSSRLKNITQNEWPNLKKKIKNQRKEKKGKNTDRGREIERWKIFSFDLEIL